MKYNKLKIFLILILSILAITITILMINMINGNIKLSNLKFSHNTSNKLVLDKTYDNNFNEISINSTAGDVYIKESTNEKIRVIIYGDENHSSINKTDEKLSMKVSSEKCIGFCFNNNIAKVEIYLPSDYDNLIKIVNDYGDINIGKFPKATIDIEEDCGDVSVLGGNVVKIDNDYGDIELTEATKANINSSSGDVEIKTVYDVIVNNQYGDINIKTVNNYLNLTADCGDITINNINLNKNSYIKDDYGDIEIENTNNIYIDAKTQLGDIKIKNNYPKSDITLKIENDCGDITVEN